MKSVFNKIKLTLNARKELAMQRSWVSYLEEEVNQLNKLLARKNNDLNELVRENEVIAGANTRLIKEITQVRNLANRIRDNLHAKAATPKEHEFLNLCADIYDNGKVIKGRTFRTALGAALQERRTAAKNRFGDKDEICALWGCRAISKGDSRANKEITP